LLSAVAIASETDQLPKSAEKLKHCLHLKNLAEKEVAVQAHLLRVDSDAGLHGIDHPTIVVDAPVLECECTEYSHVDINASSCTEGGQVDFFVSMRGLVPGFVYEFKIKWELDDDNLTHTWKSVMEKNEKDSYTLREALMQRNDEFSFGMMAWDAYKKGDDRFWIDVTVCDMYPGLTTEEALIGTRNIDSDVKTIRLKCVEHSSAVRANSSSRESANFKQFALGMQLQLSVKGTAHPAEQSVYMFCIQFPEQVQANRVIHFTCSLCNLSPSTVYQVITQVVSYHLQSLNTFLNRT
jgi:hypothetical protein